MLEHNRCFKVHQLQIFFAIKNDTSYFMGETVTRPTTGGDNLECTLLLTLGSLKEAFGIQEGC